MSSCFMTAARWLPTVTAGPPPALSSKGDANNAEDVSPVPPDVVEGRVVAVIPRLGAVLSFFKSPSGLLLLLAAGILLYVYPSLIHALKRLRQSITSRFKTKETDHDET